MRYVWVTGRVPKGLPRFCAWCCEPIVSGYLRDYDTRLIYCGPHCQETHVKVSEAYIVAHAKMPLLTHQKARHA